MRKRKSVKNKKFKKVFKNGALNVKKINYAPPMYRGGIRL